MANTRERLLVTAVACIAGACAFTSDSGSGSGSDSDSAVPRLNQHIPRDVGDVQPGLLPKDVQSQLEHLSWQTFVALNWPANANVPIGQAQPQAGLAHRVSGPPVAPA